MLAPEGNTTLPSAHPARLSLPAALQLGDHGSWRSGNIYTSIGQSSFYMLCVWFMGQDVFFLYALCLGL